MKLFTKIAIASVALAGMLQAETTLIGVDAGVTILNARVGFNAGITVGKAHGHSNCPTAYTTVTSSRTYTSDPCSYVCGPCVVVEPPCPKPAPAPACPCPCAK